MHTKLWCSIWHARHVSISVKHENSPEIINSYFWNVQICHLQINVNKYHGISIHCIKNWSGTKRTIFLHLRCWIWQAKHVYKYWSANPKTVQKLPPAQLQFAVPQEVTVGPLYFFQITSGHNDLATEKKLSTFGTTLFGYDRI